MSDYLIDLETIEKELAKLTSIENPSPEEIERYNYLWKEKNSLLSKQTREKFIEKIKSLPKNEAEQLGRKNYGPNWRSKLGLEEVSPKVPIYEEISFDDPAPSVKPASVDSVSSDSSAYKRAADKPLFDESEFGQERRDPTKFRFDRRTRQRFKSIFKTDYSKRDFIKPGFPIKTLGGLTSAGGTGKTFFVLQMAIELAATLKYEKTRGVLYLPAEDSLEEIGTRIQSIAKVYELTNEQIELADQNFQIWSLLAENPDLLEKNGEGKNPLADEICEIAKSYKRDPLQLIIIDTLRRFNCADENSGGDMAQVLSAMERICQMTGASVLFLHHITKSSALNGQGNLQQASRGSSVLSDNIRYQEFLRTMIPEEADKLGEIDDRGKVRGVIGKDNHKLYVRWGVSKQNYGAPIQNRWLKRVDGGVLIPVELDKPEKEKKNNGGRKNEYE